MELEIIYFMTKLNNLVHVNKMPKPYRLCLMLVVLVNIVKAAGIQSVWEKYPI